MSIERRKFIRFEIPLDVIFKPSDNSATYSSGITKNFSRSGCCIESGSTDLSLTDNMDLQVKHPSKDFFVPASGTIVWKQQLGDDKWLLGLDILDIDKEAKSEILDFAYDIWLENNIKTNVVQ
jgi:c-di-GMP-binding flagellar brake protein YcgR